MADDIRNCLECGTEFVRVRRQLYCTKRCTNTAVRRRNPSPKQPKRLVTCGWCASPFSTSQGLKAYCSSPCKRRAKHSRELLPGGRPRTEPYKARDPVYRDLVGKKCVTCAEYQLFHLFQPAGGKSDGLSSECKSCLRVRHKTVRYGITPEEVVALETATNCEICGTKFAGKTKVHIDHCHTTGKVRGALCFTCNSGLGMLKDSPELLERASQYVLRHVDMLKIA